MLLYLIALRTFLLSPNDVLNYES